MIQKIFVEKSVKKLPLVAAIEEKLGLKPVLVSDPSEFQGLLAAQSDPVLQGKRVLFLTQNRGPFIKKCPGTKSYICCGYQILHIGTYCTMDCSYCVLQGYLNPPALQFFVNQDVMLRDLGDLFACTPPPFHRIGTGEFTDSLIWEPWTGINRILVSRFAVQNRIVLELKTKTCHIGNLKDMDHSRKTILSWSMNTPAVIRAEERGTASLNARIEAAAQCQAWGYPVAFHFDPLILYPGWEEDYIKVVHAIFNVISPDNIVWISLGSMRFNTPLKPIIQKRFANSKIVYGEFVPGLDGKMRYFKPLRIALYKKMAEWIKEKAPDVGVYLCMEDEEVWENVLGFVPDKDGGLARLLDGYAARHCGLDISTTQG
jgi:spore photoproduct lyase